jgi:hypothetical protein
MNLVPQSLDGEITFNSGYYPNAHVAQKEVVDRTRYGNPRRVSPARMRFTASCLVCLPRRYRLAHYMVRRVVLVFCRAAA